MRRRPAGATRTDTLCPYTTRVRSWSKLTSDQKLRAKQLGVVSTIALLGLGLYTASTSGNKEAPKAPQASNLDLGAGARGVETSDEHPPDLQSLIRTSYPVSCFTNPTPTPPPHPHPPPTPPPP